MQIKALATVWRCTEMWGKAKLLHVYKAGNVIHGLSLPTQNQPLSQFWKGLRGSFLEQYSVQYIQLLILGARGGWVIPCRGCGVVQSVMSSATVPQTPTLDFVSSHFLKARSGERLGVCGCSSGDYWWTASLHTAHQRTASLQAFCSCALFVKAAALRWRFCKRISILLVIYCICHGLVWVFACSSGNDKGTSPACLTNLQYQLKGPLNYQVMCHSHDHIHSHTGRAENRRT